MRHIVSVAYLLSTWSSPTGLDMLGRLCQVEANEEVICDNLEDSTYENIVRLLTIHDIQLIVYSLETLYQLSELGEVTTTHIAAIRMAVGKCSSIFVIPLS